MSPNSGVATRPPPLTKASYSSFLTSDSSIDDSVVDGVTIVKDDDIGSIVATEDWHSEGLVVVVIGASGDLAKKKTYPSLLDLFANKLLPKDTIIWGYARSPKTHEGLRSHLRPFLLKQTTHEEWTVDAFLEKCFYKNGKSYGDFDAYYEMLASLREYEESFPNKQKHNRLFYLAIPPSVFGESGIAIKKTSMQVNGKGWSRLIIEKPFGRDLQSCEELSEVLTCQFEEHHLYRIDHYLGKEMVQNLMVMRFGNSWLEWMWHRNAVQSVILTFKEPFGTEGRGGYFDDIGIIRDVLQNHLLQALTLLAMEPPIEVEGPAASDLIRDAKVAVLKSMPAITVEDCLLGQYEGYADDPTITNKDTNCPTYAMIRLWVNTPRWAGVPFILQAGKALDERVCEMRVQFRQAPAADMMFGRPPTASLPRNELVMRLQPDPAIYMKTNVKTPGFSSSPTQSVLGLEYSNQFEGGPNSNPDAYTRLILDVLRGRQGSFVRDDELRRSWEVFTPVLHKIEKEKIRPHSYTYGSQGPAEREAFLERMGAYVSSSTGEMTRLDEKITSSL